MTGAAKVSNSIPRGNEKPAIIRRGELLVDHWESSA
jgi:hypothetical protein